MRKLIAILIAVILPIGVFLPGFAFAANLKNLEFSALPGDKVEIRLSFDGAPPNADGYTIEQPARIAIDLPGVKNMLTKKSYSLGYGNAQNITVLEAQGRTRLIVSLSKLVGHTMRTEGDALYILVGDVYSKTSASSSATTSKSTSPQSSVTGSQKLSSSAMITPTKGVQALDFRRGENGEGSVVITLGDPHTAVDINESGNTIKVVLNKASLPTMLKRRIDVVDFATPVKFVDAVQEGADTVVNIEATGTYEQMAYQTDNVLTVSVRPISEEALAQKKKDNFQYAGDKLSLNFQDIEVRSVLQLIADFTNLNLVASDTVKGSITLRLQNVPWDQALDLVLKAKGLDKRKAGNVLLVAPAAEITAREKLEIETAKQVSELAPLRNDTIRLRYAKAVDVEKLLGGCKAAAANKAAPSAGASLSSRGSCVSDTRTNTILITDTAESIEAIRQVVDIIDIPVRQVLIEARIVTANVSFAKELGVDWNIVQLGLGGDGGGFVGGNATELDGTDPGDLSINKAINLGVAGTSGIAMGYFDDGNVVALQLSAMESDDKGEIVSQPRVITADGKKATISAGQEVAYSTESDNGTNTEFKNADLSLEVTPQITPDDRVIMDIVITNDQVGQIVNGEPSIDTQKLTTQALVKNGETLVLGGIFKTENQDSTSKVPFLGDLPAIGQLFRSEVKATRTRELLIFITPKIIKDEMAVK